MMQTSAVRERDFLENLLSRLEAEGFSVFPHPSRHILPRFMEDYIPDAVALKPGKKIAIEVKRKSATLSREVAGIREKIAQHPEWELRVYYIPERAREDTLTTEPLSVIEKSITEIDSIKKSGHLKAALMASWATLEAAARALLPEQLTRPQPAERLIEVLGTEGVLTPTETDRLRGLVRVRNAAAHGGLDVVVSESDVDAVTKAVRRMIALLAQEQPPP
jgi:uncharacterized protein YutE (UPF0331/DUF86 family)